MSKKVAFILLTIMAVFHMIFGVIYLTANEFMSFHAAAVSTQWDELGSGFQVLLLALIKLAGSAGLIAGLVNFTLVVYCFKKSYTPLVWLAPISATLFQFCMHYVVYQVDSKTPGSPPLTWVTFGSCMLLVAWVFFVVWARTRNQ